MNPLLLFLLLFAGIPLVELYFLIQVGSEIGAIPTIALTVFTAVLGGMLVRLQGLSTAMRVREAMDRGEMPAIEMLEGAVLLLAGFMLLLPGFITDAIGFLLLVPPVRRALLLQYLRRSGVLHQRQSSGHPTRQQPGQDPSTRSRVIEGEYRREDDKGT